jgi:hypothetical protein
MHGSLETAGMSGRLDRASHAPEWWPPGSAQNERRASGTAVPPAGAPELSGRGPWGIDTLAGSKLLRTSCGGRQHHPQRCMWPSLPTWTSYSSSRTWPPPLGASSSAGRCGAAGASRGASGWVPKISRYAWSRSVHMPPRCPRSAVDVGRFPQGSGQGRLFGALSGWGMGYALGRVARSHSPEEPPPGPRTKAAGTV